MTQHLEQCLSCLPAWARGEGEAAAGHGASRGPAARPDCTTAATTHLVWFSFSGSPEIFFSGSSNPSEVSSSADMAAALTPLVLRRQGSRGCGTCGSHSPRCPPVLLALSNTTRRRHRPRGSFHKNKALLSWDRICTGQNVNMDSGNSTVLMLNLLIFITALWLFTRMSLF